MGVLSQSIFGKIAEGRNTVKLAGVATKVM
jgi:hypothetical protein